MRQKIFFIVLALCCLFSNANAVTKIMYVSTTGNDITGTGTITSPYQTIGRAQQAVRDYKTSYGMTGTIYVAIRGGTYYFNTPLVLGPDDSGINGYKVIYTAYSNEVVVISGGKKVPAGSWSYDINGIWKADLSQINTTNLPFRQLWVDGVKAQRSQCGIKVTIAPDTISDRFIWFDKYDANGQVIRSVPVQYHPDIEIWTYYQWKANIVKIESIADIAFPIGSSIITTQYGNPATPEQTPYFLHSTQKIYDLENAYEFVGTPGEWYYDNHTENNRANNPNIHYLFYYPLNGKDPNTSEIYFPVLEKIIQATGLSNVEFRKLTFSYASWSTWPNLHGYWADQGAVYRAGMIPKPGDDKYASLANIEFNNSSNITITNCNFTHLGAEALCFQTQSVSNTISTNSFTDVAGTAIRIGDMNDIWYGLEQSNMATKNNIISQNIITNIANEYRSHCAIWLGFVQQNQVINNTISNAPYTGISTGHPVNDPWGALLGMNIINDNTISACMQLLRDGGAIYNQSKNCGTSYIQHNNIYNMPLDFYPGLEGAQKSGIYLDECSSNFKVTDNYGDVGAILNHIYSWPLYDSANNVAIHTNNIELSSNWFQNNNFDGHSSHWVSYPGYAPEYHTVAKGAGNLGVKFVDVNHDGFEDMVYFRWISSTEVQRGVYLNELGHWGERLENHPFCLPYHLYVDGKGDMGVQFVDFDNDGYKDMIYSRYGYPDQNKAFRNTGSGWEYTPSYNSPIPMYADGIGDLGVRFLDVNGDGLKDLVYSRWLNASDQHRRVYFNTGAGWNLNYTIDPKYILPTMISADYIGDLGVQIIDLNNDNKEDIIYWRFNCDIKGAYLNTGNGWQYASSYMPPYPISSDGMGVLGVKFIDVDHDGYVDMVYNRIVTVDRTDKAAWLNKNGTWVAGNPDYAPVIPTYIDYDIPSYQHHVQRDQGLLTVDLNGDGYKDILQGLWLGSNYNYYMHSNSTISSQAYLNNSSIIVYPGGDNEQQ